MPKKPTIKDLEQQIAELTEALQRERADAMNVRRRADEERAAMGTFYKAMVIREFLPVMDNLSRAAHHRPKSLASDKWATGVDAISHQLEKTFLDMGVEPVGVVGEPFDPKYHEAVQMEEGDGAHEVVSEVLQAGYKLGDEVLRHAMVKVKMEKK